MKKYIALATIPAVAISVYAGQRYGTANYRAAKRSIKAGSTMVGIKSGRFIYFVVNSQVFYTPAKYWEFTR